MSVDITLTGHEKDLGGGFMVRRLLPSAQKQAVGPFIFFDHFGPVAVKPEDNYDVRPHPHIGLATVSYLFEGAIMHKDSLGSEQIIEPGAINWMTAGKGIVHSERGPDALRSAPYTNHGLQLWAALPAAFEEVEPAFEHTPASSIPSLTVEGTAVRVLIGEAFGQKSPVATFSETIYLDVQLEAGVVFKLPALAAELAVYSIDNPITIDGEAVAPHTMVLLAPGKESKLSSTGPARLMVLGGEALDGHRYMWWNFVSSRKERIVQASEDWLAQTMGHVEGDAEFIPLPERRFIP